MADWRDCSTWVIQYSNSFWNSDSGCFGYRCRRTYHWRRFAAGPGQASGLVQPSIHGSVWPGLPGVSIRGSKHHGQAHPRHWSARVVGGAGCYVVNRLLINRRSRANWQRIVHADLDCLAVNSRRCIFEEKLAAEYLIRIFIPYDKKPLCSHQDL